MKGDDRGGFNVDWCTDVASEIPGGTRTNQENQETGLTIGLWPAISL